MNELTTSDSTASKRHSFKSKSRLYWLVFVSTAMLILANQLVIQRTIQEKIYDEHIINVAGRQRMLSQRIIKTAYQALASHDEEQIKLLKRLTSLWNKVHWGLQRGDTALDLPPLKIKQAQQLFDHIQPNQAALYQTINRVSDVSDLAPLILTINDQGDKFLVIMDQIVGVFETNAQQKLNYLIRIEIILAIVSVLVLLCEIFFVFRPFHRKVANQNHQLRQIAYIQSHGVRRPVCSILGLIPLIQEETDPEVQAQYIRLLRISTEELEEVTRTIVDQVNEPTATIKEEFVVS